MANVPPPADPDPASSAPRTEAGGDSGRAEDLWRESFSEGIDEEAEHYVLAKHLDARTHKAIEDFAYEPAIALAGGRVDRALLLATERRGERLGVRAGSPVSGDGWHRGRAGGCHRRAAGPARPGDGHRGADAAWVGLGVRLCADRCGIPCTCGRGVGGAARSELGAAGDGTGGADPDGAGATERLNRLIARRTKKPLARARGSSWNRCCWTGSGRARRGPWLPSGRPWRRPGGRCCSARRGRGRRRGSCGPWRWWPRGCRRGTCRWRRVRPRRSAGRPGRSGSRSRARRGRGRPRRPCGPPRGCGPRGRGPGAC